MLAAKSEHKLGNRQSLQNSYHFKKSDSKDEQLLKILKLDWNLNRLKGSLE